jgi:predicted phage-related endonuclease
VSFTVIDAPQRSPEWFAARLGRLTGSCAGDMLASIKTGEAAARRDLRMQLVTERLTGQLPEPGFISAEMQRGIDKEPDAFALYEAVTGSVVRRTGFLSHDVLPIGCSLDGDVDGFTGLVELKCPKSATHIGYIKADAVPANHLPQILHNLWVTGAQWCDFVSFDDRFPAGLRLFVKRVVRDDAQIAEYEQKALAFLAELAAEHGALLKRTEGIRWVHEQKPE